MFVISKQHHNHMEKTFKPGSGYVVLFALLAGIALDAGLFWARQPVPVIAGSVFAVVLLTLMAGFFVVEPGQSIVFILFGDYKGSSRDAGFFWANPFMTRKKVSLRSQNLNGTPLKVNDKEGNPIEIAAVVVWRVEDTAKATFEVEDFSNYVSIQSEAAVRHLANTLAYDHLEDEQAELTLRDGGDKVTQLLEEELNERLAPAGIRVKEARISHLAYAPEIASAMLQRQQAAAIVSARKLIVEGAVGMVEMALQKLNERDVVHLDEERKAAMVSNLLVVLCSERAANPVVNAGTLYN